MPSNHNEISTAAHAIQSASSKFEKGEPLSLMKKRAFTRRPKQKKRNAKKDVFNEAAEVRYAKEFLTLFISAERDGAARFLLKAVGQAFQRMDDENPEIGSPVSRRLKSRRNVVVGYLASLVDCIDDETKYRLLERMVFDLEFRGCKEMVQRAIDKGLNVEYDELAANRIRVLTHNLAYAYSRIAEEGNAVLASELPIVADILVRALGRITASQPELVKSAARGMIEWPIMVTRHHPKKSDLKRLADCIGLASETVVKPQPYHTWKPDTELNQYILEMLDGECLGDRRPLTEESIGYYLDEVLMPLFEKVAAEEGGWENYAEFAAIARGAAKRGKGGVQRSEIRNRVKKVLRSLSS